MKISHDINGNKVLKISGSELYANKGFSIQTLDNLPETHRHGIHYATKSEVFNFIAKYGTKVQKELLQTGSNFTLRDIVNGEKRGLHYNVYPFWRELSDSDIEAIVKLVGGQAKSRKRVFSCLKYDLSTFPHWWLERIEFENGRWSYCAGQDYVYEMASIRKHCK